MAFHTLRQQRIDKVQWLREAGINPYPYRFTKTHSAIDVVENIDPLIAVGAKISFAGRLMTRREHGQSLFAHLQDQSGPLQIYARRDQLGTESFRMLQQWVDVGDFLGITGTCLRTKTGEPTLQVSSFAVLSKGIRPLPEKWRGIRDIEQRYRRRYVDLLVTPGVQQVFQTRTKVIQIIRSVFDSIGGLEVETPTLQPLYGGAAARPFTTMHNALGIQMYMRISPELYLKRLIVGGFECVYEICKDFRNEGMDRHHNPEFTMVEIYWAYRDYHDMMGLTERLFVEIARAVNGSSTIFYQDQTINLEPPWPRRSMLDMIWRAIGIDLTHSAEDECRLLLSRLIGDRLTDVVKQQKLLQRLPGLLWGEMISEIFDLVCADDLVGPVFVTDYPLDVSPLAKVHRSNPRLTERFELFVGGWELANAFSELNDPLDQRRRFELEAGKMQQGDEEAHPVDEDFLRSLEYGMPPCGGLGIGVDRLVMLFTNQPSIQDVILFPQMRPDPGLMARGADEEETREEEVK